MNSQHHLDDATLVGYCTGSLPQGLAVVAGAHLQLCAACRTQLRQAERIGGLLMHAQVPAAEPMASGRLAMLARLDEPAPASVTLDLGAPEDADLLPVSLHAHFGQRYSQLPWRRLIPGVRMLRGKVQGRGSLVMFNIAPGTAMPVHSHGRSEITLVLKGAYRDALGHFGPGDIADLDETIEHQPVAWGDSHCICVAATDAPLRFSGLIPRLMQPFIGL
jgi:putative transcriptional regulator